MCPNLDSHTDHLVQAPSTRIFSLVLWYTSVLLIILYAHIVGQTYATRLRGENIR